MLRRLPQSIPSRQRFVQTSYIRHYESSSDVTAVSNSQKSQVAKKSQHKQVNNVPFVKNLFSGSYIYDYLRFPEYESNSELKKLHNQYVEPVRDYLSSSKQLIDSSTGLFTKQANDSFKQLNLFSQSIGTEFNGCGLDSTSVARILEELGVSPSLAINLIYNNEIVAKAISSYGTAKQKADYLSRMSTGELRGAFCYAEPDNGSDTSRFETLSLKKDGSNRYVLNGKKSWVCLMTDKPDQDAVFLVVCTTAVKLADEETDLSTVNMADSESLSQLIKEKSLSAFLVDKNKKGVTIQPQHTNQNGLVLYSVEFKNVEINRDESLLGSLNSGFDIATRLVDNARYLVGPVCLGLSKDLFKQTVEFVCESRRFGKALSEHSIIKDKIARIECDLYTMESMIYMTAGIQDSYQQADIACESALTKIYCTETMRKIVNECLDILAMSQYDSRWIDEHRAKNLKDANYLINMFHTNDMLKLYVANSGLINAGLEFAQEVSKLRNPFSYPGFAFRQFLTNRRLFKSSNKKVPEHFYLWEHVHPSLNDSAGTLEQLAIKFMLGVKSSLINHGREIVDYQFSLKHLTDLAMYLYALNSIVARASRSYSIGLPNSQHELWIASVQSRQMMHQAEWAIASLVSATQRQETVDLNTPSTPNLEGTRSSIADRIFMNKNHAAVHALTRNY